MEADMRRDVISILEMHRTMAVATLRPDGWPQATIVNYANDGLALYFLVSRSSQKFANLAADSRASIALGRSTPDPADIRGLSMSAHIEEVRDEPYRSQFRDLLARRCPGYFKPAELDFGASALMRARPEIITISDYSQGLGHADVITVGAEELIEMKAARPDNWGPDPAGAAH
jgi:hypothetical protein